MNKKHIHGCHAVEGRLASNGEWVTIAFFYPKIHVVNRKKQFLWFKWTKIEKIVTPQAIETVRNEALKKARSAILDDGFQDVLILKTLNNDCGLYVIQNCIWKNSKWIDEYTLRTLVDVRAD